MRLSTGVLALSSFVFGATGCIASQESLGSDDAYAADGAAQGSSTGDGGHDGASGQVPAPSTEDSSGDDVGGVRLDVGGLAATCATIDHETCYPAVLEACVNGEGWSYEDPACIAAVSSCYPLGTDAFGIDTMISVCSAELEETCLISDAEGCGQAFCECTIGVYPFYWSNCWHELLVACNPFQDDDCAGALAGCYPDATVEEYQACREVVLDGDRECDCPRCGKHEQCDAALAECLGA